ncbi:hypothetical protein BJV82DRAFT_611181 [Fennellomyces sp. T-0311]|nr:hypothetical protein BJV82DRAFT_611181 [Fennellomyces sp. T-0311]
MGVANDYRISQIVVLCKDCGQDVGLYPARHKCEQVIRPPLPPINFDKALKRNVSTTGVSRIAVDANQWKCVTRSNSATTFDRRKKGVAPVHGDDKDDFFKLPPKSKLRESTRRDDIRREEGPDSSIYYDKFAANLPGDKGGKNLWDKVRGADHHKLPWAKNNETNTGKLWGKLMDSVQNKLHEDDGPESDASDWEGESHVSRVLREHYEKRRQPLPRWLSRNEDSHTPLTAASMNKKPSLLEQRPSHRRHQKLWEQQEVPSQRELEREALRHQVPREEAVTRSQTMRHQRPRRDLSPPTYPQKHHHHEEQNDVLDTIYNNYLSDQSVVRSRSERRYQSSSRKMQVVPPMVGGYF